MKNPVSILCSIFFILLLSSCTPGDNPGKAPESPRQPVAAERDSMVELSWDTVDDAELYRVYWSNDISFTPQTAMDSTETSDTQFSHTQLNNDTTYYYRVTAISVAGESIASPVMSATPGAPPGKPARLDVSINDSSLLLSWQASSTIDNFSVSVSMYSDMADPDIYTTNEDTLNIQNLVNGQEYFITLTAINSSGTSQPSSPARATPSKLHALATGYQHSCAIKSDRSLWCWGRNQFGQTGTGAVTSLPVTVPTKVNTESEISWETVSAGEESTCGIDTEGQLWCWGDNRYFQLGLGTTRSSASPAKVSSDTDWVKVASGSAHHCAIKNNGTLWCWGWNSVGQTGTGSFGGGTEVTTPTRVGDESDWAHITLGTAYSCALKTSRTIWCWGKALESPEPAPVTTPVLINTDTDWDSVSSGAHTACAIKTSGMLWCWGYNFFGQVGNGISGDGAFELLPIPVGSDTDWKTIRGGGGYTCAVKDDNSLWCWGYNGEGQLGDGSQDEKHFPFQIGTKTNWQDIAETTSDTTCAFDITGNVYCWGYNGYAETGTGGTARPGTQDSPFPVPTSSNRNWSGISSGFNHTCASRAGDSILCWGDNTQGQLGNQSFNYKAEPTEVVGVRDWKSVVSGSSGETTCGLKPDNRLWCWGRGIEGQFGNNSSGINNSSQIPVPVNTDTDWARIAIGFEHVCAIKTNNTLWCWGDSRYGKLGIGNSPSIRTTESAPVQVGQDNTWVSVAAGEWHTCGIKSDNSLWCWGDNSTGQAGDVELPDTLSFSEPVMSGATQDWQTVITGSTHTCALKLDASVWCWGDNFYGQTANDLIDAATPVADIMPGHTWTHIAAGYWSTCGIRTDQTLWCWGVNDLGQLGINEAKGFYYIPGQVEPGSLWNNVSPGYQHTCGLKSDNSLWCWGSNWFGALGDGTAWKLVPQAVMFSQ